MAEKTNFWLVILKVNVESQVVRKIFTLWVPAAADYDDNAAAAAAAAADDDDDDDDHDAF